MSLHSKFLIHWTGWDFDYRCLCPDQKKAKKISENDLRQNYLERFRSCCKSGLHMNKAKETVNGQNNSNLSLNLFRVCFTEIRLTQVEKHAQKYGYLGIGFDRKFVIDRCGNPVFYVTPSTADDLMKFKKKIELKITELSKFVIPEQTIKKEGVIITTFEQEIKVPKRIIKNLVEDIANVFNHRLNFVKGMSKNNSQDFEYYEEMEWR